MNSNEQLTPSVDNQNIKQVNNLDQSVFQPKGNNNLGKIGSYIVIDCYNDGKPQHIDVCINKT